MLYSNIASLIKNEADEVVKSSSRKTNRHRYQARRSFIIGRIKDYTSKILCGMLDPSALSLLYEEACRHKSEVTPDRFFPRKGLKSKGRSHYNNKKTCV